MFMLGSLAQDAVSVYPENGRKTASAAAAELGERVADVRALSQRTLDD
jgi:hypothetical protein